MICVGFAMWAVMIVGNQQKWGQFETREISSRMEVEPSTDNNLFHHGF